MPQTASTLRPTALPRGTSSPPSALERTRHFPHAGGRILSQAPPLPTAQPRWNAQRPLYVCGVSTRAFVCWRWGKRGKGDGIERPALGLGRPWESKVVPSYPLESPNSCLGQPSPHHKVGPPERGLPRGGDHGQASQVLTWAAIT